MKRSRGATGRVLQTLKLRIWENNLISRWVGRLNKPRVNGCNIVGCNMLCPFVHPVACCCFVSVYKKEKNNLANIQPSWPHAWSKTHSKCYYFLKSIKKDLGQFKNFDNISRITLDDRIKFCYPHWSVAYDAAQIVETEQRKVKTKKNWRGWGWEEGDERSSLSPSSPAFSLCTPVIQDTVLNFYGRQNWSIYNIP